MAMNGTKLGELLLHGDVLTKRQLNESLAMQEAGDKRKLGEILIELGYITVADITDVMMEQASKAKAETEKSKTFHTSAGRVQRLVQISPARKIQTHLYAQRELCVIAVRDSCV